MSEQFIQKLNSISGDKYTYLKLEGLDLYRYEKKAKYTFLIKAEIYDQVYSDAYITALCDYVQQLTPYFKAEIVLKKSHADIEVVLDKIYDFIRNKYISIAGELKKSSVSVEKKDEFVVTITISSQMKTYLESKEFEQDLLNMLYRSYCDEEFSIKMNYVDQDDIDTTVLTPDDEEIYIPKVVSISNVKKHIGREVNRSPQYISSCDREQDNIVLCGTLSAIKQFTSKKNNKEYFVFMITDPTASISCMYFPKKDEQIVAFQALREGQDIVCEGSLKDDLRTGGFKYFTNSISLCNIDKASTETKFKSTPKSYRAITPEPYQEISQDNFLESEDIPYVMYGKTYVVFDLETTGLDTATCEIIDIAGVKIVDGVIKETFSSFVYPSKCVVKYPDGSEKISLPEEITNLTGIKGEDLDDAPLVDVVMADFYKFTRGATILGHNAFSYDLPILKRVGKTAQYNFDNEAMDTIEMAKKYLPGLPKYNLGALCSHLDIPLVNAHRALADAMATAKLFKKLAQYL